MNTKHKSLLVALALAAFGLACGDSASTGGGANASNTAQSAVAPQQAPGNSEIETQQTGDTTLTKRIFKDPSSPVERVEVTTQGGRRTGRVYLRSGEVRELTTEGDIQRALDATGDTLVSAGTKVVDATKAVGSEVGDKAEDVKDQTVKGAKAAGDKTKDVGSEVGDKAEDVGDKAASGAKKAGKAAASGVKKVIP